MGPGIVNCVKELRIARGWTQEQLAQAVGVSRQSINSIERDRYMPSLTLALTFARVFGCSTDQIFQLQKASRQLQNAGQLQNASRQLQNATGERK